MTMKRAIRVSLWVGIAALSLAPWAFAQIPVSLTSAGGNVYDGVYVSPYYATVNGVPNTPVVCDDFADESQLPSSWSASVVSFSSINSTNTSWGLAGGTLPQYNAVAYLTLQVLQQAAGSTGQIINTFADWAVFDPSGVASYLTGHPLTSGILTTAALCTDIFGTAGCSGTWSKANGGLLATAYNASVPSGGYNLRVISPDLPGSTTLCKAETGCAAQEFIAAVPEGGAAVAYLLLAAVCCFGAMFLRSRRQTGAISAA
jgi:hypothetical protein